MPPKRRPAASAAAAEPATKSARPSKLAKENNITAQEEAEIREAFSLFAEPMDGEKEGVMPIGDVRRALIALGIPPNDKAELPELTSVLDPDDEGFAPFAPFVAVCALKLHARDGSSEAHARELDEAFSLFAGGGTTTTTTTNSNNNSSLLGNDPDGNDDENSALSTSSQTAAATAITMAHLKRVAALLKEDVADDLLKDMILEANGGAGVARGVRRDEFDAVMRRAGVWR